TAGRSERRRILGRRLPLSARPHDVRPADDDAACAAVVGDRKPAPVRQQRLLVRPEHAAQVRRVLERGVEVDVIRHVERKLETRLRERDPRPVVRSCGGDRAFPGAAALCHERIQRSPCEDAAQTGQVDGLIPVPPQQSVRTGSEAHRILSSSSSASGSKNEQVPIEWKSEERTSTSCVGNASRSRQRNEVASSAKAGSRSINASSSFPKTAAARTLRKPCSPAAVGNAWWRPAVALKTTPRARQPRMKSASSSTLGTRSPPQRIFARSPRAATSSSSTPS